MEELSVEVLPKGTSKVAEISLGGLKIKVRTDATPAILKKTKDLVQAKFDEIQGKATIDINSQQLSILVALNLAEDLINEQEKLKALRRKVLESSDALINRVEAQLSKTI
ncbi:MAG: cell division protein ZapA [Proteobacteria bacterium]|jgi:cell division protein ZapA (FtsZ GTPase activity inhibitor)|nr:cell division protein ZapA [Pseudomonadota bacterium]